MPLAARRQQHPPDEEAVAGGMALGQRDQAADEPEKDEVEQRRQDRRHLVPGVPPVRGDDDERQDDEPEPHGGEQCLGQRVRRPFGKPLMDERDEPDDGEEIAGGVHDHGNAVLRRRPTPVQGVDEVPGHEAHDPGPEVQPRRASGSPVEAAARPQAVGDSRAHEHGDHGGVDRGVEHLRPDATHETGVHHDRPGPAPAAHPRLTPMEVSRASPPSQPPCFSRSRCRCHDNTSSAPHVG